MIQIIGAVIIICHLGNLIASLDHTRHLEDVQVSVSEKGVNKVCIICGYLRFGEDQHTNHGE